MRAPVCVNKDSLYIPRAENAVILNLDDFARRMHFR